MTPRIRVLCLGNELMGDDSFGFRVAEHLRWAPMDGLEIVTTSETGFHLLDHILGVPRLVVIDTIITGKAEPGTIYEVSEQDLTVTPGDCPHGVGLMEVLAVARKLGLDVPCEVSIIAVEASEFLTIGGTMHAAVESAVPKVANLLRAMVKEPISCSCNCSR